MLLFGAVTMPSNGNFNFDFNPRYYHDPLGRKKKKKKEKKKKNIFLPKG
jgi:hypothetical protein